MDDMSEADARRLINAIANRDGTAKQLAVRFGVDVPYLIQFTADNKEAIQEAVDEEESTEDITVEELDNLWITKKGERLQRIQNIANKLYDDCMVDGVADPTSLREFRSYMVTVANELGQLMHRGQGNSGEGDTLSVEMVGVDPDKFR